MTVLLSEARDVEGTGASGQKKNIGSQMIVRPLVEQLSAVRGHVDLDFHFERGNNAEP
jgi:hypothetical protein